MSVFHLIVQGHTERLTPQISALFTLCVRRRSAREALCLLQREQDVSLDVYNTLLNSSDKMWNMPTECYYFRIIQRKYWMQEN